MKANPDKSNLPSSNSNLNLSANTGSNQISNENVKLLGITFDNSLSFDDHVSSLRKKNLLKHYMHYLEYLFIRVLYSVGY